MYQSNSHRNCSVVTRLSENSRPLSQSRLTSTCPPRVPNGLCQDRNYRVSSFDSTRAVYHRHLSQFAGGEPWIWKSIDSLLCQLQQGTYISTATCKLLLSQIVQHNHSRHCWLILQVWMTPRHLDKCTFWFGSVFWFMTKTSQRRLSWNPLRCRGAYLP